MTTESERIDSGETYDAVDAVHKALDSLEEIVGSNGIGNRKVVGKKTNSVREEIHAIRCSLARIRGAAKLNTVSEGLSNES